MWTADNRGDPGSPCRRSEWLTADARVSSVGGTQLAIGGGFEFTRIEVHSSSVDTRGQQVKVMVLARKHRGFWLIVGDGVLVTSDYGSDVEPVPPGTSLKTSRSGLLKEIVQTPRGRRASPSRNSCRQARSGYGRAITGSRSWPT